jgi:hypothetical protein
VRVFGVNGIGRSCGLPALTPAFSRKQEREQFKFELECAPEFEWMPNYFLTTNAPLALTSFTRISEAFFWSSA